jgi:hypothetical protein
MQPSKLTWCILVAATVAAPSGSVLARSPKYHHHNPRAQQDEDRDHADHYRDRGAKPSKAAALGVAVQSRALLDKSGTTDFELTTGQLDSSIAPSGNIDQVKLRAVRPDGKKMFEKDFEHLRAGGYFHQAFNGLPHGLRIETKTHVSGFGRGKETVPFKLDNVVLYRPDVTVSSLQYPTVVRPKTFVTFSAVVAERMNDVGAHFDCELLIDGARVDAVPHMWIDAGSTGTCRLTYKFDGSGNHTVAVRAQNVTPGDFDGSNNQISGRIVVEDPAQIFYSASVDEVTDVFDQITDTYASASSTSPDQHVKTTFTTSFQGRLFNGSIPAPVKWPLARIGYSDTSDGRSLSSLNVTNVSADANASGCQSGDPVYPHLSTATINDDASNGQIIVRVYSNDLGGGRTTIDMMWNFTDVTYVSTGYCNAVAGTSFSCSAGDWIGDSGSFGAMGVKLALGATYAASVVVDDGTAYTAQPSMALTSTRTTQPLSDAFCWDVDWGAATMGKTCMQFADDTVARHGEDKHLQ